MIPAMASIVEVAENKSFLVLFFKKEHSSFAFRSDHQ